MFCPGPELSAFPGRAACHVSHVHVAWPPLEGQGPCKVVDVSFRTRIPKACFHKRKLGCCDFSSPFKSLYHMIKIETAHGSYSTRPLAVSSIFLIRSVWACT